MSKRSQEQIEEAPAPRRRGPKVDVELTRQRISAIVQEAARLFDRVGYHGVNMEMIAEAAGVRKPTLYHYIRGKDQILFEIHEIIVGRLHSKVQERITSGESAIAILRTAVFEIFNLIHDHPGFVRAFFEHFREMTDENRATLRKRRAGYVDDLVQIVTKGMADGEIAPGDPRITVLTVLGSANWAYQWYRPDRDGTPAQLAEQVWALLERGLRNDGSAVLPSVIEPPVKKKRPAPKAAAGKAGAVANKQPAAAPRKRAAASRAKPAE